MVWVNTTAMTKDEIVEKLQGMDVLTDGVEEPWSAENFLRCLGEVGGPFGGYHAMTTAEWENYSHQAECEWEDMLEEARRAEEERYKAMEREA